MKNKVRELIVQVASIDFSNGINSYTIQNENKLDELTEEIVKLFAIPDVSKAKRTVCHSCCSVWHTEYESADICYFCGADMAN